MVRARPTTTEAAGGLWGLAEATLFFIVPDVLLSAVALTSVRRALVIAVWVLAGALVGGALMWAVGRTAPETGHSLLVLLPAIDAGMVADVGEQLGTSGLPALFAGPVTGTPYKIYAVQSGQLGIGLVEFLLVSIPARMLRFVAVTLAVGGVGRVLERWLGLRARRIVLALSWSAFYAWYFYTLRG